MQRREVTRVGEARKEDRERVDGDAGLRAGRAARGGSGHIGAGAGAERCGEQAHLVGGFADVAEQLDEVEDWRGEREKEVSCGATRLAPRWHATSRDEPH